MKRILNSRNLFFASVLSCVFLASCSGSSSSSLSNNASQLMTVQKKSYSSTLYFSGYVEPLVIVPAISPTEGAVIGQYFHFGDAVKAKQKLYSIRSLQDEKDIQDSLASFLKAKDSLNSSKGKMQSSELLHKNGLVSDDDYDEALNTYYTDQLAFFQAKDALQHDLKNYPDLQNALNLTLSDTNKIQKFLSAVKSEKQIDVYAPSEGVALLDSSSDSSSGSGDSSDGSKNAKVGSQVKSGQVLVNIGQHNGIALNVKVDEINVDKIKIGLEAVITNVAVPGLSIKGKVQRVSLEADSSGALPTFAVRIVVDKLTKTEQEELRFGMSAKIAVTIKHAPEILVPVSAIINKAGNTYVNEASSAKDKQNLVQVETGDTTMGSVVILSGLRVGDKILVPN